MERARRLRAAILYPEPSTESAVARGDEAHTETWSAEAYDDLLAALRAEDLELIEVGISFETMGRLQHLECDLAINLCDGCTADGDPGVEVIDALEARRIPYTGARRLAYWVGSDKVRTKLRLVNARVPTPRYRVAHDATEELEGPLSYPLFVKPRDAAGSAGIDLESRCDDEAALRARLAAVIPVYGDALVEEFVDGRELSVAVLGDFDDEDHELVVFPPVEALFGAAFPAERRVQTFATKYDPNSPLFGGVELVCPAPLERAELEAVNRIAGEAWRAIGGTGYGRVDLRLGRDGPMVLEVNPNCSLEWVEADPRGSCMFPIAAKTAGWSLRDVYRRLIEIALTRPRLPAAEAAEAVRRTTTSATRRKKIAEAEGKAAADVRAAREAAKAAAAAASAAAAAASQGVAATDAAQTRRPATSRPRRATRRHR